MSLFNHTTIIKDDDSVSLKNVMMKQLSNTVTKPKMKKDPTYSSESG